MSLFNRNSDHRVCHRLREAMRRSVPSLEQDDGSTKLRISEGQPYERRQIGESLFREGRDRDAEPMHHHTNDHLLAIERHTRLDRNALLAKFPRDHASRPCPGIELDKGKVPE